MRKQVLGAVFAAGALAIPVAAAASGSDPVPVTGHSTLSAKQASNYIPVLTAHRKRWPKPGMPPNSAVRVPVTTTRAIWVSPSTSTS